MKEFVEKLIGRLEEQTYDMEICEEQFDMNSPYFMDVEYKMVKIDDIKDTVNQLAEEYNNGWIPCSERLPEKYGEYLCCDTYGNFILGFPSESNTSDTGFIVETEYEYCYDIISWMELPEKYKEKKNGSA